MKLGGTGKKAEALLHNCSITPVALWCMQVWPQQDLILRYQLPADNITADMQVLPNPNGGSFMLSLMPPGTRF